MKKFIKNNRFFILSIITIVLFSIGYKIYKVNKGTVQNNKEVVTVILRENEIIKGLPKLVEKFNEENDNIFIKLEFSSDDYNNVVYTKMANKNKVDIVQYMGKSLVEKEFIQPLDDIGIDYSNVNDNSLFKYNDKVIGVKYGSSMPKLMYNDEILEECGLNPANKPKTLDQLIVMLEVIKEKMPEVQPLDISIFNIHDLFSSIGLMSTSEGSIYPTFWNYKTGEYDYSGAKEVLAKFNYMYENNLISSDFDKKTSINSLEDFQDEKSAIVFVNSAKKYSVVDRSFNLKVSFGDIPLNRESDKRYYYTSQRILSITNNYNNEDIISNKEKADKEKHEDAVKTVFEWLLSDDVTEYLAKKDANFATFIENPFKNFDGYKAINNNEDFYQSTYDPTEVLAANATIVQSSIFSIIKGESDIDDEINNLNESMNTFIKSNVRNEDIDFENYKE